MTKENAGMDEPLITIGIPSYNRAPLLREALDALLLQSHRNLEIIIGDNASSDDTSAVCDDYARRDPRVRVFRHARNIGMMANHNFILARASGVYFVWACDDDLWHGDFIRVLARLLASHPEAVTSMCNCSHMVGNARQQDPDKTFDNTCSVFQSALEYARNGDYLPICGMHVTATLRQIGGYHHDYRPFFGGSDYLTILKMALRGKLVFTNEVLFFKRDTGAAYSKYSDLEQLRINRAILRRIVRYGCFPLFYLYNVIFGLWYVWRSAFRVGQKMRLTWHVLVFFARSNLIFIGDVVRGCYALAQGVFRSLTRPWRTAQAKPQ